MNKNIRMRSVITENIDNLLRTHQLGKQACDFATYKGEQLNKIKKEPK